MRFIEQVTFEMAPGTAKKVKEAFAGELPDVLNPKIRAITAEKVTKNKTFYPLTSFETPSDNAEVGIASLLYPYPKPILRDHNTGGGGMMYVPAEVYGRVRHASIDEAGGKKFVSVIANITDPKCIEMILSDRFLTVSIGIDTESVKCSICGMDVHDEGCDHMKGHTYFTPEGKPQECYWIIGPVTFEEISFVSVPSDTEAGIITKNVESFKGINVMGGENKSYGQIIFDEYKEYWKLNITESAENEIEGDDDAIVTLGDMYGLGKDDPDYNTPYEHEEGTEAKLTTKQRKSMSDSTFCGPGRSFPVNDAVHAAKALQMLPRYKGPGDKAKIRACVLRKAQLFKKKEYQNTTALGWMVDDKYHVKYPIFPLTTTNTAQVFAALEASTFSQEHKDKMLYTLGKWCNENKLTHPEGMGKKYFKNNSTENTETLQILLNDRTYPLLYTVMDAVDSFLMEQTITFADMQLPTKELAVEAIMSEELKNELTSETPETKAEVVVESTPIVESTNPQPETKVEESKEVIDASILKESVVSLESEISNLTESILKAHEQFHMCLATEAAILMKALGRSGAKGKGIKDLTESLVSRSTVSLQDTVQDLLEDFDTSRVVSPPAHTTPVAPAQVESVTNPVLVQDDVAPTASVSMPSLEVKEEVEDTYVLFMGPGYEEFKKNRDALAKNEAA